MIEKEKSPQGKPKDRQDPDQLEEKQDPLTYREVLRKQTVRMRTQLGKEFEAAFHNPRHATAALANFQLLLEEILSRRQGTTVPRVSLSFARLPTKLNVPYQEMLDSMRETLQITINHSKEISVASKHQDAANNAKALAHILCDDLKKIADDGSELAAILRKRRIERVIIKVDIRNNAIPLADVMIEPQKKNPSQSTETKTRL